MDDIIVYLLYAYGLVLSSMVIHDPQRLFRVALAITLTFRFICVAMRTSLGSDVPAYTSVLLQCDLSSINSIELFWQAACLPSAFLSELFPFPFFWIGLMDCALFALIAKLGGLRLASLHDLIYLQSTSLGAIRQALAMKLILVAVLLYVATNNKQNRTSLLIVLTAPFVHLAAIVPAAVMKFMTSGLLVRFVIIASPVFISSILIDDALLSKLMFYLDFEGFRSIQEIYVSWAKRLVVIAGGLLFGATSSIYWGIYSIGLIFAASEFLLPEIAVRIGAYFEQFEVFIVGAAVKPHLRRIGLFWYSLIAIAYTARFLINISSIPL